MLSKQKAAKRAAISATVRREHQAREKLTRPDTQLHTSRNKAAATASTSSRDVDDFKKRKSRTVLRSTDETEASSGAGSRADTIRSLGDHINTRLQEVAFEDDLDGDVFHERRAQLMEEARLAAGVQQRDVSTSVRHYLGHRREMRDLDSMRIAHNCNSITCVAALGMDRIVYGDKSGKVYLTDVSLATSGVGMAVSDKAELQRRRKVLLEPALPSGIVSIAISDTTANRPTARDVFEKTTVDMSCPSYVAAGAMDGCISVWETFTKAHKGLLFMHRKPITGLRFRMDTAVLYSCCEDGTLRVWVVPQMIAVDKLFGHEGPIHFLDCLRKETAVTVGEDGTMRFWKMEAATQQAYSYAPPRLPEKSATADAAVSSPAPPLNVVMDAVAMLNESIIVAGARDGTVVVFDVNRRKPLVVVPAAHGCGFIGDGTGLEKAAAELAEEDGRERLARGHATASSSASGETIRRTPNPITAVAAVPYADIVATASYDGVVRVWHVVGVGAGATAPGKRTDDNRNSDPALSSGKWAAEPQLVPVAELPVRAIVNALHFSDNGNVLIITMSKEPRRGRWVVQSSARNGVLVVPLTESGRQRLQGVRGEIEHIPAQLFGIDAAEEEDATREEEEEAHADVLGAAEAELNSSGELHANDSKTSFGREDGEEVADMFDIGPDGMMRFREGVSLAGGAVVASKRRKAKSGIPKVLRQTKELVDVTVARNSGSNTKKVLSAKKVKCVAAKSKRLHVSDTALAVSKKAMKKANA
ncbi:WD domain [Leishmania braziliensis]|nr:WD domain [Leishmania braziliensis]